MAEKDEEFEVEIDGRVDDDNPFLVEDEPAKPAHPGQDDEDADGDADEDDEASDGDDDDEDEEPAPVDDDGNRAKLKRSRNAERRLKRDVAKLTAANAQMQQLLQSVVQHQQVLGEQAYKDKLKELDSDLVTAKAARRAARRAGDEDREEKLDDLIDSIRGEKSELERGREAAARAAEAAAKAPAPSSIRNDLARTWAERHAWFDPFGDDRDSAKVRELSKKLHAEGYDPTKPAHFRELTRRLEKSLPHRFQKAQGKPAPKKAPPPVAAGSSAGPTKGKVTLPAEVVRFAKRAGLDVTDKAVLRSLAKQYMDGEGK